MVLISTDEARSIAQRQIDRWNLEHRLQAERLDFNWIEISLYQAPIAEGKYGWVFAYQSVDYLKSGHFSDMLAGNAPLLVERTSGKLIELGTAYSVETYVENLEKRGDPNSFDDAAC
ncbi:YrhB domain-containing protein [Roseibium sp.]|uniref:YrhB domain-containing protein n=1 Tax=Roseibium sp. TaxID=1936156 RepID=UPI003BAF18D4